jgi:hypothetical protein
MACMVDHLSIQCADTVASAAFYDGVLATLGGARVLDFGDVIGYGAVDQFCAAAVAAGAEVLYQPRMWPEYHPGYYAAFVRDPDGNNVEAVCHTG